MRLERNVLGKLLLRGFVQTLTSLLGEFLAKVEEEVAKEKVLDAQERGCPAEREEAFEKDGGSVLLRQRSDV